MSRLGYGVYQVTKCAIDKHKEKKRKKNEESADKAE